MSAQDEYPQLFQLFAGYFNQDWSMDYSDADEVINQFVEWESEDVVRAAAEELGRLLAAHETENLREILLRQLSCYYDPEAEGVSTRQFLASVLARLVGQPDLLTD